MCEPFQMENWKEVLAYKANEKANVHHAACMDMHNASHALTPFF